MLLKTICPSLVFLNYIPSCSDQGQSHSLSQITMHQAFKHTSVPHSKMHSGSQSGADTTGSSCQLILAVGSFERCFGFYCMFRGLNLKYLVFSTFVWPVLLAVILYFLLHINQATISGMSMCVSENSE